MLRATHRYRTTFPTFGMSRHRFALSPYTISRTFRQWDKMLHPLTKPVSITRVHTAKQRKPGGPQSARRALRAPAQRPTPNNERARKPAILQALRVQPFARSRKQPLARAALLENEARTDGMRG